MTRERVFTDLENLLIRLFLLPIIIRADFLAPASHVPVLEALCAMRSQPLARLLVILLGASLLLDDVLGFGELVPLGQNLGLGDRLLPRKLGGGGGEVDDGAHVWDALDGKGKEAVYQYLADLTGILSQIFLTLLLWHLSKVIR